MGAFHPPKSKLVAEKKHSNAMIEVFKSIAIEMAKIGKTDVELEQFAREPRPESLGLKPDPYRDAMFVQIQERTTFEERLNSLGELAESGQI